MLSIEDRSGRLCDGHSRREFLRVGAVSLLGLAGGPAIAGTARAAGPETAGSQATSAPSGTAKRCIVLFLLGGPPQHSTWDPKPEAPEEIRGAFGPIATSVPGTFFCELMPRTASWAHKIAVLRAVSTGDHAHSSSGYAMLTGHPHQPLNFENANPGPPNDWPTLGAVVQHLQPKQGALPPAIRLPHHIFNTDLSVWPGQDSGFLGAAADPWLFRCQPASADFQVPDFQLPPEVPLIRLEGRRQLLRQLDRQLVAREQDGSLDAFDQRQQQAFQLLGRAETASAFRLDQESAETRDRYGRGQFGQSVLLARRLVEAGVSLVQVNWFRGADEPSNAPCWDSHANETERLRTVLVPPFDLAFSALLEDLENRGLLDETLVVCMGEFGRTPKFNPQGGRDHWGHAFSMALAGGGIQGGVVHGATDPHAAFAREGLVRPEDLLATIFRCLGYPPETTIHDRLGRAFPISRGQAIREIL